METITAFLAKSFAEVDQPKVQLIENLLTAFRPQGFLWNTAERSEVESVSEKVRKMIDESSVFVGVFTQRHAIHDQSKGFMSRYRAFTGKYAVQGWTCPPWLLQESGYALALGKRLILFRELAVEIPGLQGDLEYIDFDPSNPTAALQHANEMINSLIAELRGISVTTAVEAVQSLPASSPEIGSSKESSPSEQPPEEKTSVTGNPIKDMLVTAITKKEWSRVDELLNELEAEDADSALSWQAWSLYVQFDEDGNAQAFDHLKELYKSNPKHVVIAIWTARSFGKFGQYDEAVRHLKQSAGAVDNPADKRNLIINAVRILKNAKKVLEAKELMLGLLSENAEHQTSEALELLSQVLREYGDIYSAVAVGELTLKKDPVKLDARYRVGLDYHTLKQWSLFLWQYKMYCKNNEDGGGFHNLALAYSECELPIHCVQEYLHAYKLGTVLSANNLAYKYLDAGMANEAQNLIKDALTNHPDSASEIGRVLAEITERQEEENKKEERLLDEATKMQEFVIAFGEGFVAGSIPSPNGIWAFKFGNIELHLEGNSLIGSADIKRTEGLLSLAAMLNTAKGVTSSSERVIRYTFEGKVTGRSCKFTLEEQTIPPAGERISETILGSLSTAKRTEGYIVFQHDMQSAQVMEIRDDKWKSPYVIERAPFVVA